MKHIVSSKFAVSLLAAVLLSGVFGSRASAEEPKAPDGATATDTSTLPAWLSVTGILGVSLGQSLFTDNEITLPDGQTVETTSYWSVSYLVVPRADLGDFDLSLGLALEQWMSDRPDAGAVFALGESLLNLRWRGYDFEDVGLSFSPTASLIFPTSPVSDLSGLFFATEAALDIQQRIATGVALAANVGWRKNIHGTRTYQVPSRDQLDAGSEVAFASGRGARAHPFFPTFNRGGASLSRPEFGGHYPQTSSVLHLGLALEVSLPSNLGIDIGYSLYSVYPYDVEQDLAVAPGVQNPDSADDRISVATVDLRYSALSWLTIGAGTATTQPTHTPDNDSLRFPFWDLSEFPNDNSTIRVYAIGRY